MSEWALSSWGMWSPGYRLPDWHWWVAACSRQRYRVRAWAVAFGRYAEGRG